MSLIKKTIIYFLTIFFTLISIVSAEELKKIGKFKEILNSVKYIDNNDYLNGCILKLDGGYGLVPHR